MTRETRIAMLVGLMFIVMFGLVLSELTGNSAPQFPLKADKIHVSSRTYAPVVEKPIETADVRVEDIRTLEPVTAPEAPVQVAEQKAVIEFDIQKAPERPLEEPKGAGVAVAIKEGGNEGGAPADNIKPAPPAEKPLMYIVKPKDTAMQIASVFYGPEHAAEWKQILKANDIKSEAGLKIGQEIKIPAVAGVSAPHLSDANAAGRYREMTLAELKKQFSGANLAINKDAKKPADKTVAPVKDATGKDAKGAAKDIANLAKDIAKDATKKDAGKDAAKDKKPAEPELVLADPPKAPESAAVTKSRVVRPGDSLQKIAKEMFKDDSRETIMKIYKANKGKLKSPDALPVGVKLEIPA